MIVFFIDYIDFANSKLQGRSWKVATMSDKVYVNGVTVNGAECNGNGTAPTNGTVTTVTAPVDENERIAGVFYNAREDAW